MKNTIGSNSVFYYEAWYPFYNEVQSCRHDKVNTYLLFSIITKLICGLLELPKNFQNHE